MSTSYRLVCFTCKTKSEEAPSFASGSIAYGFKVWNTDEWFKWLGHGEANGHHEGHDLRIVSENVDLPWDDEPDGDGERS